MSGPPPEASATSPELEAFRVALPGLRTSDLLGFLKHGDQLLEVIAPEFARTRNGTLQEVARALLRTALKALEDEIDLRIPARQDPNVAYELAANASAKVAR